MSAKDINLYETKDYGFDKKPKGISKKEWAQDKVMHYENSLSAAKTFKFNAEQNKIARDFNEQEAQKSRDWQTNMSNTAHQREVKDLKKSGLNPVLAANNGAQSYTTSAASITGASGKADSDASAIAAYGGSYLNSQAQKYSARMSAAAMKYSADQALAAAQTQAAASMYNTRQQIIYGIGKDFADRLHDSWKTSFNAKNNYKIAKEDREEATKREQYRVDNGTIVGRANKFLNDLGEVFKGKAKPDTNPALGALGSAGPAIALLGKINRQAHSSNLPKETVWRGASNGTRSKAFTITQKLGLGNDRTAAQYILAILEGNRKAYTEFRKYLYRKYEK